ncbi:acylsugar acyltransferase 3 [Quercus suber]|uniref:Acylsugar acyltransferase 3 n=1 Tax=Quercus suber TaxID=58331 RepID=A0AAW0L727_QUESU
MAIGVCLSHKVGDAATMASFINDWATMTRNPDGKLSPEFNLASMFPQGDLPILPEAVTKEGNSFSKRFVFDASKIAALKAIVGDKVKNPTRVEVVTALIYKCAFSASRSSSGSTKPTLWCNFPLYEADFGWGKPIWVTVARCAINGAILLMDARSGNGVEVFVTLEEQDMAVFERDAELLEFASSNPSALDSDLKPTSLFAICGVEDKCYL